MSTSVLAAANADHHHNDGGHPTRRGSGRRKVKGCDSSPSVKKKNKKPQRGMGVAKLERVIWQESWKKMTEIDSVSPAGGGVSFRGQIPKMGGFGHPNVGLKHYAGAGGGCLGFQHGRMDLFGLSKNYVGGNVCRGFSLSTNGGNCLSEHCTGCLKKTKFDVGDSIGKKQGKVEVVAVHRKESRAGHVMMEYEFFPSRNKLRDHFQKDYEDDDDELVMMNLGHTNYGSPSSSSMPGFGHYGSTCVDLSLKLSY